MDFDQMMDAWKAQDHKPLYGVNRDLLQLVLRHEQTSLRRTMRIEQWITYLVGLGMALFAGFWLWVAILRGEPALNIAAAAVGTATFVAWVVAFWLSRRRLARRERSFGNTLQAEVRRNLSLVEYQLSNAARLAAAFFWSAPPVVGALLIVWLTAQINTDNGMTTWDYLRINVFLLGTGVFVTVVSSRAAKRKLEPRRQRLLELLESLNASD